MVVAGGRAQNAWWMLGFNRRRRGHNGKGRRVLGVLRRGVLCAAVRSRTWMCPTLIAQAVRHVWLLLRIDGTADDGLEAPSS